MHLLVCALAVLWAWEYLVTISPIAIPPWLQPALVAGCAIACPHLPLWLVTGAAVAGAVALLHRLLDATQAPPMLVRRRRHRVPPL